MSPMVKVLCPAKLNLFLEVLERRPDGYHEVETVMHAVDLYDELAIEPLGSEAIELSCDGPGVPTDERNLVVRAARLLRERTGCRRGARIERRGRRAGGAEPGLGPRPRTGRTGRAGGRSRLRRAIFPRRWNGPVHGPRREGSRRRLPQTTGVRRVVSAGAGEHCGGLPPPSFSLDMAERARYDATRRPGRRRRREGGPLPVQPPRAGGFCYRAEPGCTEGADATSAWR